MNGIDDARDLPIARRATVIPILPLAALPWLALPYDSVAHLLGVDSALVQTLPLTALLAPVYLVVRGRDWRVNRGALHIGAWLTAAVLVVFIVTSLNIAYESMARIEGDASARLGPAMRQAVSLMLGLASFWMFVDASQRLGLRSLLRWLAIGGLPTLLLAVVQAATGALRIQGFSSEPSHLADMLVLALIPAIVMAAPSGLLRLQYLVPTLGVLLLTFSTTGFLKFTAALGAVFVARGQTIRAVLALPVLAGLTFTVLSAFEDNYVFHTFNFMYTKYMETGELLGASFIDRFYGFAGPISMLDRLHTWLGYGLGSDTVYFYQLFDADTAEAIRDVKGDIATIASLQGKWMMYGGLAGFGLYTGAWVCAWRRAKQGHVARVMIPVTYFASLFSLAPLFLPFVWLWLALAAASVRDPLQPLKS